MQNSRNTKFPIVARWLLRRILTENIRSSAMSDIEDTFNEVQKNKGKFRAILWYWTQLVILLPNFLTLSFLESITMLKHYVMISGRNFQKNKSFSFINISGLAIGMTCSLLILVYVKHELSFDKFHEKHARIFRVGAVFEVFDGSDIVSARTPQPLAPVLDEDLPQIESAVRINRFNANIKLNNKQFIGEQLYLVDKSFFDIFTFPLLRGSITFDEPNSILITERAAKKYFSGEDAIGKILTIAALDDLLITGILKDVPANSHLTFDLLVPYSKRLAFSNGEMQPWDSFVTSTYVLLQNGQNPDALESEFNDNVINYVKIDYYKFEIFMDNITELYLNSDVDGELGIKGSNNYIYLFSVVSFLILLIACFNYAILSTARSVKRAREVGIKKVLGANRSQLVRQFLSESIIFSFIASFFAIVFAIILMPFFNTLSGKELTLDVIQNPEIAVLFVLIAFTVGLVAGIFPAVILSAAKPITMLRNQLFPNSRRGLFGKSVVVFQLSITIIFLVGTLSLVNQLDYLREKNMGFDRDQILVFRLRGSETRSKYEIIKNELLKNPNIVNVAASNNTPGQGLGMYLYKIEGSQDNVIVPSIMIDFDFLETYGMNIVSGRNFSGNNAKDNSSFIINETAATLFNGENPIGKTITWDNIKTGEIIGMVNDFHFQSLHNKIKPMILQINQGYFSRISVKIKPGMEAEVLAFIREIWNEIDSVNLLEYSFVDEDFERFYQAENKLTNTMSYASILAIAVGALGFLGMSIFSMQSRVKEICIRKTLGANLSNIIFTLTKKLLKLTGIAFVIGFPIAFFVSEKLVQNFAYKAEVNVSYYIYTAVFILLLTMLTSGFHTIKTALSNPAENLRHE